MNDAEKTWVDFLTYPTGKRNSKPRNQGLTMVIDKGLGLGETRDILNIGAQHIDIMKLGFGTSALYSPGILMEKIEMIKMQGIDVYPGGTFLEIAIMQNKLQEYLQLARELGFTTIEVSDGTIEMTDEVRERAIKTATQMNFKVLTEVGKKEDIYKTSISVLVKMALSDLEHGAWKVILEGRESGMGVGLYDEAGNIIQEELAQMVEGVGDPSLIIWETPRKEQQQEMILRFGSNVNLGNIPPHEVIALEALRVGFRADTLKSSIMS